MSEQELKKEYETVDAVLIQPCTGIWDKMTLRPPEGLLALAAVADRRGYRVAVIDQRVDKDWKEQLENYFKNKPLCVGIGSMTGEQLSYAIAIINFVKKISEVPVVFGGPHATLLPKQTIGHKKIDFVVVGEGDYTFYEILGCLRDKKSFDNLKGVYYKKNDLVCFNGPAELIKDLDKLPDPPYHLIDIEKYETFDLKKGKSITLMTSRGCPYQCKFCATPVLTPVWRGYSIERVIQKIKKLQKDYGIYSFYFQDDNLAGNFQRFIELVRALNNLEHRISWGTLGIRADTINRLTDREINTVYESGCHDLDIGVETGNPRVNKFINKGESIETIVKSNRRLARYPIKIKYTFIVGFPTETKEERQDSVNLAIKLNKENQHCYTLFFPFTPIFGTEFFKLAVEHGFKLPANLKGWSALRFDDWLEKYPSWLSKNEIKEIESLCFVSVFANKNVAYKFSRPLLRFLLKLYYPIAYFRFKHQYYNFFVEIKIRRIFYKMSDYISKLKNK